MQTDTPVPVHRFWAKTGAAGWHPLLAHSADVAAVLECLLHADATLGDRLAGTAGAATLRPADRSRLVYLAALHDCGKA
ncbi:MAG: hypothetical protein IT204_21450, partial [Fimbriimonadaceae bacterium]|nr:hypothetical protein [Fimbriimonadaceae bacterium]